MSDDKKIIFSMVGLSKNFGPQKQVLKNIYLSFFYGAKIGIIGLNGAGENFCQSKKQSHQDTPILIGTENAYEIR